MFRTFEFSSKFRNDNRELANLDFVFLPLQGNIFHNLNYNKLKEIYQFHKYFYDFVV
jgi:hypothetical protein